MNIDILSKLKSATETQPNVKKEKGTFSKTEMYKACHFHSCTDRMAQWRERSPPTNVSRVWFPDPASYVGWVCCWFSSLLWEGFLRVLRFSPLQTTFDPGMHGHFWTTSCELLGAPWVNKLHYVIITFLFQPGDNSWKKTPPWINLQTFNYIQVTVKLTER